MYTAQKTAIGKLRMYRSEIAERYESALRRGKALEARQLYELGRRVRRAILLHEEFQVSPEPVVSDHLRYG